MRLGDQVDVTCSANMPLFMKGLVGAVGIERTAIQTKRCALTQWRDIDYQKNQILVRRAWSKGKETAGKTKGSMKPVAMHPALAEYLKEWRNESPYGQDSDWVFASFREKGSIPRAASRCGRDYLRPAAVADVIAKEDPSRFGWHNLRHSLATFFASNEVHPSVIQASLRHAKPQTTARYIQAVNTRQVEAQGKFLEAIKIGARNTDRGGIKWISGWPSGWKQTTGANLFP